MIGISQKGRPIFAKTLTRCCGESGAAGGAAVIRLIVYAAVQHLDIRRSIVRSSAASTSG
jgi:hypothetical protein